jgi:hypothetical protein
MHPRQTGETDLLGGTVVGRRQVVVPAYNLKKFPQACGMGSQSSTTARVVESLESLVLASVWHRDVDMYIQW